MGVETTPIGSYRPCCLAKDHIPDGAGVPIEAKSIDTSTVFRSPYMRELRQQFMAGQKPATCGRCWNEEAAGRTSKRQHSLNKFRHLLDSIDFSSDDPKKIMYLDLKLGNICNLRCRICGSWSSSRWAQEDIIYEQEPNKKSTHAYKIIQAGRWPDESEEWWQDLEKILPTVESIEFTGGEPFLVIRHYDFIKKAVDLGVASRIHLHYNTNATMYPAELEEHWRQFREVEIAFSIDNIGDRFEFERHGAGWFELENNLKRFQEMAARIGNMKFQSCTTVNILNVYYLPEIIDYLEKQNLNFVYLNMLHDPSHMNIGGLTPAAKDLVMQRLDTALFPPKYHHEIMAIRAFIEQGSGSDGKAFCDYMRRIDERRDEDFAALYPELAAAMGYAK